jgi:hypothetical protein
MRDSGQLDDPSPAQSEDAGFEETRSLIARAERDDVWFKQPAISLYEDARDSGPWRLRVWAVYLLRKRHLPELPALHYSAAAILVPPSRARTSWLSFSRSSGVIRSQHWLVLRREWE